MYLSKSLWTEAGFIKKILLGIFIGIVLTIPCVSLASSIMPNNSSFKVKINDNPTAKTTVNVGGVNYISVDDVSELFGYDLYINNTDGEVNLLSKDGFKPRPVLESGEINVQK